MKRTVIFTLVILTTIFLFGSFTSIEKNPAVTVNSLAPIQTMFMQANNINTTFRTDGTFNLDKITFTSDVAGFIWPVSAASRLTADFATGLWIGAKVGTAHELRTAIAFYNSHFTPGNIPVQGQVPPSSVCNDPLFKGYHVQLTDPNLTNGGSVVKNAGGREYTITYDAWSTWPVDKGAPYVEVNAIPGYQPGFNADRPGIGETTARPDEIVFMMYMDYTNCTNALHTSDVSLPGGTLPLGAEVQQIAFAFNTPGITNLYFTKWKITNRSSNTWDSTYISIVDDADIGDGSDDAAGCDSVKGIGFIYNADNSDAVYGSAPPVIAYKMLQGPMVYTGIQTDTAKLPYGNYVGYKVLGLSGYNVFANSNDPCLGDPSTAAAGYDFMRGRNGCGNAMINYVTNKPTNFKYSGDAVNRSGWFDSTSGDKRQLMNSGPFTLAPGATQNIVTGSVIGRGASNYASISLAFALCDTAKNNYFRSFGGTPIGLSPISTEVPNGFALYQNYPNPFNPATKIKFSIPFVGNGRDRSVHLDIYDALGREITVLVNENLAPGTYAADFDASKLPSGVYFYRLSAGEYNQTMKMVLLK
jgi:hypothetical protein